MTMNEHAIENLLFSIFTLKGLVPIYFEDNVVLSQVNEVEKSRKTYDIEKLYL